MFCVGGGVKAGRSHGADQHRTVPYDAVIASPRALALALGLCTSPAGAQPWLAPSSPRPRSAPPTELTLDDRPFPGRIPLTLHSRGRPQHAVIELRALPAPTDRRRGPEVRAAGACNTPCTLFVLPGLLRLRATAPGLRDTEIDIDVRAATTLTVRAPSADLFNVGTGLTAAGATAFVVLGAVALGQAIDGVPSEHRMQPSVATGVGLLGALLLGGGIPLLVAHRTGVTRDDAPP